MKKIISLIILVSMLLSQAQVFAVYRYKPIKKKYEIKVDFGEKLTKQEEEGYQPLVGNNWQKFQQAVAELPEEIPVLDRFEVKGETCFYVSPDGSDSNDGSIEKPFRTIQRAVDVVGRESSKVKQTGVVIYVRQGEYILEEPISIEKQNCDMVDNAGLFITAYNNEKVTITTASCFRGSDMQLVKEENTSADIIGRMAPGMLGHMYYIDYDKIGIEKLTGFGNGVAASIPALYKNSDKLTLARYPNVGTDYVEKVIVPGQWDGDRVTWVPEDKKIFSWKGTSTISAEGQMNISWFQFRGVLDIDKIAQTLSSNGFISNNIGISTKLRNNTKVRSHLFYMNIFEELDMENEWCGDDEAKRIYYYPLNDELNDEDMFSINTRTVDYMINVSNAANVVFNGIEFSNGLSAVHVSNSKNVILQDCSFYKFSNNAIRFSNCKKSGSLGCVIEDVRSGVSIESSESNLPELVPHRNFIQDTYINKVTGACTNITGHGNIVSHNLFENFYGDGINMSNWGNENIYEYNEMRSGVLQGNEGQNIYFGGAVAMISNHARYNYIHDNQPPGEAQTSAGSICVDDMGEYIYFYKNISENQSTSAGSHSGDNQIFWANISIDCANACTNSANYGNQQNLLTKRVLTNDTAGELGRRYFKNGCYESDTWNTRYPDLRDRVDYYRDIQKRNDAGIYNWESDEAVFMKADTGCFYVDNISVNTKPSGPSNRGEQYLVTDIDMANVTDENIKAQNGTSYNVVSNEQWLKSIDLNTIEYFDKIGLVTKEKASHDYDDVIDVIYPRSSETLIEEEQLTIKWMERNDCNYYKTTLAYDEAMEDIAYTITSPTVGVNFELPKSEAVYYYRVEGYLSKKDVKGTPICSSPVYKVLFKSTYEPPNDGVLPYGTPVIDSKKDNVYDKSPVLNIGTSFTGKLDSKKANSGELRFAWDESYLYVFAEVNDTEVKSAGSTYIFETAPENPWKNDALELYIQEKKISLDAFGTKYYTHNDNFSDRILNSLPFSTAFTKKGKIIGWGTDYDKDKIPQGYIVPNADGYIVEMALPLSKVVDQIKNDVLIDFRIQNNDIQEWVSAEGAKVAYSYSDYLVLKLGGGPDIVDAMTKFVDLNKRMWYKDSINYLFAQRYVNGVGEDIFAPDLPISRAMFISILGRFSGDVDITKNADVWYNPYLKWALTNEFFAGTVIGEANINENITREEMAVIISNVAEYIGFELGTGSSYQFKDVDEISESAVKQVNLLNAVGIVEGFEDGTFRPKQNATRAEACKILYTFINLVETGDVFLSLNEY